MSDKHDLTAMQLQSRRLYNVDPFGNPLFCFMADNVCPSAHHTEKCSKISTTEGGGIPEGKTTIIPPCGPNCKLEIHGLIVRGNLPNSAILELNFSGGNPVDIWYVKENDELSSVQRHAISEENEGLVISGAGLGNGKKIFVIAQYVIERMVSGG